MSNKIIFGADLIDVLENKYNMNKLDEVPTKYKNGVTTVDFIYGKNIDDLKYDKPYVEFSIDDETDGFISGTMYLNGEGVQFDSWEDLKYFMKNAKWTESKKSVKKSIRESRKIGYICKTEYEINGRNYPISDNAKLFKIIDDLDSKGFAFKYESEWISKDICKHFLADDDKAKVNLYK